MKALLSLAAAIVMSQFEFRLKRIIATAGLVFTGVITGSGGIIASLFSFFFYLADMDKFVFPALITGIILILIAALIAAEAYRMIRLR